PMPPFLYQQVAVRAPAVIGMRGSSVPHDSRRQLEPCPGRIQPPQPVVVVTRAPVAIVLIEPAGSLEKVARQHRAEVEMPAFGNRHPPIGRVVDISPRKP